MPAFIGSLILGLVCVALGVSNMRGNISSLHWYHRHRVSEEDRPAFGRQVGLGTIVIGVGLIVFSVLSAAAQYSGNEAFIPVGSGALLACIIVGLVMSFRAMIKYNRGIF